MRHADGVRHFDRGVRRQGVVDLQRRDVGTAGLDDVGEPAFPVQPAGVVEIAAVASAEIPWRRVFRRAGCRLAEHQCGALDAISPRSPRGTTAPVSGSTILSLTPGNATPLLSACTSGGVLAG